MLYKLKRRSGGQSLFEVMFAVAIASIIMLSVVALSKRSISSSDFSRNNALASRYTQEATDWIRERRDSEAWETTFYDRAGTNPTLCLSILDWAAPCDVIPGTIFSRSVTLAQITEDGKPMVEAEVIVIWQDGSGMHQVKNISRYSNWNI